VNAKRTGGGSGTTRDIHGRLHIRGQSRRQPASQPALARPVIDLRTGPKVVDLRRPGPLHASSRWAPGTVGRRAARWASGLAIAGCGIGIGLSGAPIRTVAVGLGTGVITGIIMLPFNTERRTSRARQQAEQDALIAEAAAEMLAERREHRGRASSQR